MRRALTPSDSLDPALGAARAAVLADATLAGEAFGVAFADVIDDSLRRTFSPPGPGYAVVALGTYGRGGLCPASDVDVLLLHPRRARDVGRLADALWYPLWDAGFELGHSVRSVRNAVRAADDDLETLTSLVDVRVVAGDADVVRDLVTRVRALARRRRSRLVGQLADAARQRWERPGPVAELLEPNLKNGAGGLRDIHALGWIGWALDETGGLDALVAGGYLDERDRATLERSQRVLLEARVANHRVGAGRDDVLRLQDQDVVARAVGAGDADVFVRGLSGAARRVAWIADDVWTRLTDAQVRPGRRVPTARTVADGVVIRDGRVAITTEAVDGDLLLRAAGAVASSGHPFDRDTLARLAAVGPPSWNAECRADFLSVLASGRGAIGVFEALDHVGALSAVLPEWSDVRSLPQRNPYHRFTVDRHLLETVAECAALAHGSDFESEIARAVEQPEMLGMAALLHDIGKGPPGDHSERGAALAVRVGARIGLADLDTLEWLVRYHLLLAETAMRRDLADPTTVRRFAELVGDPQRMRLLHLLTVGDSRATGPAAWGPTKAALVRELTTRTLAFFGGAPVPGDADAALLAQHHDALGTGSVLVQWSLDAAPDPDADTDTIGCTVVAPDQRGLLAVVAGALTVAGFDVSDAVIVGDGAGMALEQFRGTDRFGRLSTETGRTAASQLVTDAIAGIAPIEVLLDEFAERYPARPLAGRRGEPVGLPLVSVDLAASDLSTVVEVDAPDQPGLLARLARVFADHELDVVRAKVATLADRVLDIFYVRESDGSKLVEERRLRALRVDLAARAAGPGRDLPSSPPSGDPRDSGE